MTSTQNPTVEECAAEHAATPKLLAAECAAHVDAAESSEGSFLPRCSPFVGYMPHAPCRRTRSGQLDRLLQRRSQTLPSQEVRPMADKCTPPRIDLRRMPYVGYRRHAPPSPQLSFQSASSSSSTSFHPLSCSDELDELELQQETPLPGGLPEELWQLVLSGIVDLASLVHLMPISKKFVEVLRSPAVWSDRVVRVSPRSLETLAQQLGVWLPAWSCASRLIVPKSQQLLAEIAHLTPALRVDVAWRFNRHLRGSGVDVVDHGLAARRVADKELVVLGDAPLLCTTAGQYLEVCLDERVDGLAEDEDGINDFGLGVTACDPDEIDELGEVAVMVPRSWVVDFTHTGVVLSVNDELAVKGKDLTANELRQGDRVGLRITPKGAVEVLINGVVRQLLDPPENERVPPGARLFPVLDLCGPSLQFSRTSADELLL